MTSEVKKSDEAQRVTKAQVFKYLNAQFEAADYDADGALDIQELESFLYKLAHPKTRPEW